jgi:hypothetical protein
MGPTQIIPTATPVMDDYLFANLKLPGNLFRDEAF